MACGKPIAPVSAVATTDTPRSLLQGGGVVAEGEIVKAIADKDSRFPRWLI
jgi:hypothetical protein